MEDGSAQRARPAAGWRVAAASVCGTSHQRLGLPCQDAHGYATLDDGALLIVVADGAGSAAQSQVGSDAAVRAVLQYMGRVASGSPVYGVEKGLRLSLDLASQVVGQEAMKRGLDPRELATTLMVVRATPTSVAAAQVGDGAAVALGEDGVLLSLTRPLTGEYSNSTVFLTTPEWRDSVQYTELQLPVKGIAAFSDGLDLIALSMPYGRPHAPFFGPIFGFAATAADPEAAASRLGAFLSSPRVAGRADDDLTLVVGAAAPPSGPALE